jgi:hypothetical protein
MYVKAMMRLSSNANSGRTAVRAQHVTARHVTPIRPLLEIDIPIFLPVASQLTAKDTKIRTIYALIRTGPAITIFPLNA